MKGQDNQTHLLAAMLGGSNTDPRNFVAMHRYANSPTMRSVEFQIRDAVKAGQQVDLRVTPIYQGTSARPGGITMQAVGPGPDPLMLMVTILNKKK
ncbi:DNA/RNA non-specific endonuclease [Micromonospora sp. NPDC050200]|uniref:DNA/RNA non-specific endonuclease n=1 Tax=Micromonospora sp. NPDC050200 TaxID=3155664 RepID=UPI0033C5B0F5